MSRLLVLIVMRTTEDLAMMMAESWICELEIFEAKLFAVFYKKDIDSY